MTWIYVIFALAIGLYIGYAYGTYSILKQLRKINENKRNQKLELIHFLSDDIDTDSSVNYEHIQKRDI